MKPRELLLSLVISWDTGVAVLLSGFLVWHFARYELTFPIAREIYLVCINVLAIVFSVFFAALAILITAGDNEFVRFLSEEGAFTQIILTFRISLSALFVALCLSILLYILSLSYNDNSPSAQYPEWIMLGFAAISSYALIASISSALDAIKYAEYRAKYLSILHSGNDDDEVGW